MTGPDPRLSPERALVVFRHEMKGESVEATEQWLADPIIKVLHDAGDDGIEDYQIEEKLVALMNSGIEMPMMFKLSAPHSEYRYKFIRRALSILFLESRAETHLDRWRLKDVLQTIAERH